MTFFKKNPDVVFRKEEKEALLFNSENTETCLINSTGIFIWSLCDNKISKGTILSKIEAKFKKPANGSIEKDLTQFLEKLIEKEFLLISSE